jgi:hypothetical protein
MPRRGEHHHDFPTIEDSPDPARIGVRLVRGHSRRGEPETVRFDPAEFGCRDLAAELADEWVDYATITMLSAQQARSYCQAIREFCRIVDESACAPVRSWGCGLDVAPTPTRTAKPGAT